MRVDEPMTVPQDPMQQERWRVYAKPSLLDALTGMPAPLQRRAVLLFRDLERLGPVQSRWPNYCQDPHRKAWHCCELGSRQLVVWKAELKSKQIEVADVGPG